MGKAAKLTATASRLIKANGEPVVFTRTTSGTFDPATGTTTGDTTTNWTVYAVPDSVDISTANGQSIQAGDVLLLIESTSYVPEPNDRATYAGNSWQVVSVPSAVRLQGSTIIYNVQVRR